MRWYAGKIRDVEEELTELAQHAEKMGFPGTEMAFQEDASAFLPGQAGKNRLKVAQHFGR